MEVLEILPDPRNKMVLEGTLDELVEKVGGNKLVNVCPREVICERLERVLFKLHTI